MSHPRRFKDWWKRIFFWQHGASQEFKPKTHHDHALVFSVAKQQLPSAWRQLRFLSHVFSPRERRWFWISVLFILGGLLAGFADVARPHLLIVPATGGALSEALVGSPKLINPLFAPLNDVDRDLSGMIFSGLFRINEQLEVQPDLVERYRWLNQETLEVTLRKDARFHDGEPVKADDVVFTYQAAINPDWHSPLATDLRGINVTRINDQTLTIQFSHPHPDNLMRLTVGILPAHVWEEVANPNAMLAEANLKPIGAGPYTASSFTRDSKGTLLAYTLKRFAQYHGAKPYIGEWVFRFYQDRAQALQALHNHQVDALAFIPWSEVSEGKTAGMQRVRLELPQETVAFFNVKDPLLQDTKMRRALTLAVDQQLGSPFPFLNTATTTGGDLETARTLLHGLNWKLQDGETVRAKPATRTTSSTKLALTIEVPDQADLLQIAEELKRRWSLIGAEVNVRKTNAEILLRAVLSDAPYQIVITNVLLSPSQDLTPFWSSKNSNGRGLNISRLSDKSVDQALDIVAQATSTFALTTARQKLSQAISAQYPAVFLSRPSYAYLVADHVRGVSDQRISRPSDRLLFANKWYIQTTWRWK